MAIFAGRLASALAQGQRGRREGEDVAYQREQGERQYQDSLMMRELAMRQSAQQQESLQQWRQQQIAASQEDLARRAAEQAAKDKAAAESRKRFVDWRTSQGTDPRQAEVEYDSEAARDAILKPAAPPSPRNIDPLSPAGVAAAVERQRQIDAAKPQGPTPADERRARAEEQKLVGMWGREQSVKNATEIASRLSQMKVASPGPAGDLSLIFGYMKILDPTSVVREGEQASAANTRGVPDTVRNLYNKILRGDKLTPQQRVAFVQEATTLATAQRAGLDPLKRRFGALSRRAGADSAVVVGDPYESVLEGQPQPQQRRPLSEILGPP